MTVQTETWQHQNILTNGIRMHYVTQGEGSLIVLLHGFPEFWYSWHNQLPFLAELGYKVVAPDLRGYNESDKPAAGYEVQNLLRDLVGLIRGLGYEKAVIVGHDWGGILAWGFAISYPEMTEKLIVLNAPHPAVGLREMRTAKQLRKSWYIFAFQLPWLPEYLLRRRHAEVVGRMLYSSAIQKAAFPPDVLEKYRVAMSKPGAIHASLEYYRQLFRNPMGSAGSGGVQSQVRLPTLLIWGEQDVALGLAMTEGLDKWVPDIQVRRIADSGHWVQQEKPELVNQYMEEFLKR